MNSIQDILSFRRSEMREDYYAVLGCDPSASQEQIMAEYKVRARQLHPDKQHQASPQEEEDKKEDSTTEFQLLQEAKETLTDPEKRGRYDKWLGSGLAVSFKQWESLKGAVHTSMHWAAPRTIGRMISVQKDRMRSSFSVDKECSSPNKNQEEEEEEEEEEENVSDPGSDSDGVDPEDVEYEPKSYASLGFRVPTPPPGVLKTEDEKAREEDEAKRQIFQARVQGSSSKLPPPSPSSPAPPPTTTGGGGRLTPKSSLGSKRKAFAERRDSSLSSMHIMDVTNDEEMRRRFRNYEI